MVHVISERVCVCAMIKQQWAGSGGGSQLLLQLLISERDEMAFKVKAAAVAPVAHRQAETRFNKQGNLNIIVLWKIILQIWTFCIKQWQALKKTSNPFFWPLIVAYSYKKITRQFLFLDLLSKEI